MTWSPSSGLSCVTDNGPAARPSGGKGSRLPHATTDEGSVSLHPGEHLPRLPETTQDIMAGGPLLTSNENYRDLLANGLPTSRRLIIISITSGEHSRRQKSTLSKDSTVLVRK